MNSEDNKNLILAMALSMLVFLGWTFFFDLPARQRAEEERLRAQQAAEAIAENPEANPQLAELAAEALPREEALALDERVTFDNPRIDGGISLTGGRIDNLSMKDYRTSIEPGAPEVTLLTPRRGHQPYYAYFGWLGGFGVPADALPTQRTVWTVESGDALRPGAPVTLKWESEAGLIFRQTYSLDENYMFTIEQSVENGADSALTLAPYASVQRIGRPASGDGGWLVHEGAIGAFDGEIPRYDYGDLEDFGVNDQGRRVKSRQANESGWIGFTDKYWLTALSPTGAFSGEFAYNKPPIGPGTYATNAVSPILSVQPGETKSVSTRFFAGAKVADLLRYYQDEEDFTELYESIDWGWFFFLTKPFFWLLNTIYKFVGNFAIAIVLLTLVVKAALFPLAYRSYASMAKMKKLQPQMEALRERTKNNPQEMQKEMIALYKREKVNPAAGCLPILLQIPVFFSLYKVLFVALEMRHAYGFGWIEDLSAPDPTSIFNLFGLLDVSLPTFLLIGILPIIMGITMWLQQQLNPAPTDPTQKMIFAWMPVLFTFLLGSFPAGLVIYWIANNVLTIIQQASIMRAQGVKIELLDNLKRIFSRSGAS